ncbi:hypothetical protein ZHAS_00003908 [Anopheles sinensis]|uniref:Uncharacterized protein n=1 Tax=Anopheles sinensis TaxID=74873 RepID=A0A084VFK7_ANOSI|nr:hypothetical protein ZHAS_00003908 [Anopheles sinensis]
MLSGQVSGYDDEEEEKEDEEQVQTVRSRMVGDEGEKEEEEEEGGQDSVHTQHATMSPYHDRRRPRCSVGFSLPRTASRPQTRAASEKENGKHYKWQTVHPPYTENKMATIPPCSRFERTAERMTLRLCTCVLSTMGRAAGG